MANPIETKVIPVRGASHRFAQGKIEETNAVFILSKRTGMTVEQTQSAKWNQVGTFPIIREAIDRSTKDDFFNRPYDEAKKLWPDF